MYEPLEACAADFANIQKLLADPECDARLMEIQGALEATAKNISDATGATELERNNLARLYRGMLAASRVVSQLMEKRSAA
ncbi:type III secretion protein [Paraburkholderia sediminicola]|uniref:type III secretion protein n=1 Tax=Paraburkholderia sediminicola TaxID=458836 RepID=UPI0038BBBB8B